MVRYHLFIYVALKDEASIILWGGGKLSRLNKCSQGFLQARFGGETPPPPKKKKLVTPPPQIFTDFIFYP